ncbi:hypothetical protein GCM10011610_26640 [Nocardia rhizosphaerihabitans]|uniref:Uncharacterized protein n=1 Tax=Nocardia rhizosphaerihabitans TaxID=1691570 RepID=A0ABQ2KDW0_9NOCA|nr:hypothetical protein GCM10011610_26640 [Nocardia rhizosphaerihabitans]
MTDPVNEWAVLNDLYGLETTDLDPVGEQELASMDAAVPRTTKTPKPLTNGNSATPRSSSTDES